MNTTLWILIGFEPAPPKNTAESRVKIVCESSLDVGCKNYRLSQARMEAHKKSTLLWIDGAKDKDHCISAALPTIHMHVVYCMWQMYAVSCCLLRCLLHHLS